MFSYRKVGGLHFFRLFSFGFTLYRTTKRNGHDIAAQDAAYAKAMAKRLYSGAYAGLAAAFPMIEV